MGAEVSKEEHLDNFARGLKEGPDLRVNQSIVKFCSPDSSESLQQHFEKRKAGNFSADWIKSLVEKVGDFTPVPELAGLGSLVIAIFIDLISHSASEESTKEALQSVFAEEKASEVWDQIDECLKRCRINLKNKEELQTDIKRIESNLSLALTRLKNSMDRHMSSQALKAWVNGAAFHVQMLIHLVRLRGTPTCEPAERLLEVYQSDLDKLFRKHREMVENKCREKAVFVHPQAPYNKYLVDEDSKSHCLHEYGRYETYLEAYYDRRYSRQLREIQQHFREVRDNLQSLVRQRVSLNVQ